MSEDVLDPFIVTLDHDRIAVRFGERDKDRIVREEHFASADLLINELNTNPFELKTQKKLGLWLYRELPVPPDDPLADSPVFTIRDRGVWGQMPWELVFDGSDFLLQQSGARFQVFTENKLPGNEARALGPLDRLKIAMIDTDYGAIRKREELISRLGGSSGFYLLQGQEPREVRKNLRGIQPDVVLMDATSSAYLTTTYMLETAENVPVSEKQPPEQNAEDEKSPDWPQAAEYLFKGAAPPLIVAPYNEGFALDALATGADRVVLCSRFPVDDDDYYDFALEFLHALSPEQPLDLSFINAVTVWQERQSGDLRIPLIYSRFSYFKPEIDDGFDDRATQASKKADGFEELEAQAEDTGKQSKMAEQTQPTNQAIQSGGTSKDTEAFETFATPEDESDQESEMPEQPETEDTVDRIEELTKTAEWAREPGPALPSPDLRTATELSSYRSDVAATDDRLGVQSDVENLCQVIMAKQWKPPLSIGLFGDWGSGKTSFINLMRKTIEATAERARTGDSAFVKDVIQIDFNAWHYLDANLWANLVVRILEGIRNEVFGTVDEDKEVEETRQIFDRLHILQEELDKCNAKQDKLTAAVGELDTQIGEKETEQETATGKLATLKAALSDSDNAIAGKFAEVKTALSDAISSLGLGADTSLTKARAEAEKVQQFGARIGAAWRMTSKSRLWWVVLPVAVVVYWVGADPTWTWLSKLPGLKEVTATVTTLLGVFISWSQSLAPHMQKLGKGLKAIETANAEVEAVKGGWLKAQQKEIAELETQRDAALEKLKSLKTEKTEKVLEQDQLTERVEQLKRGKGLEEFLMTRAGSADYQQQLGIIALVHKDMRMLQQKLRAGMKADENGTTRTKKYDRVVLYIDDLDRCTPARVVEVLQAIHLLLSIPLFVVVVAVDPGWLLQCLLTHYQDLLHKGSEIEKSEWRLTPQNYLEKIFQIPFTLPSMGSRDFPGYVEELFKLDTEAEDADKIDLRFHELENTVAFRQEKIRRLAKRVPPPRKQVDQPTLEPGESAPGAPKPPPGGTVAAEVPEVNKEVTKALEQEQTQLKQDQAALRKVSRQQETPRPAAGTVQLRFESNPKALQVSGDEQEFVTKLLPLLTTPRMTKRMLNVYRLIRVSLEEDEIGPFEMGEHQAVLLLLAIMYSYPSVAPEFFTRLNSTSSGTITAYVTEIDADLQQGTNKDHVVWRRLLGGLREVEAVADIGIYKRWTEVVGRYSFQVGHELSREQS